MVLKDLSVWQFEKIARTVGTPVYVYSKELLAARCATLVNSLAPCGIEIHYSLKANPNPELIGIVLDHGVGVDASSPGDLSICRAAGLSPERVGYTNCFFADEDADALEEYPAIPALGSKADIAVWARRHPSRPFLLRMARPSNINLYNITGSESIPPKSGFAPEEMEEQIDAALSDGLRLVGLHCHLGSEQYHAFSHIQILHEMESWFRQYTQLDILDLGGGFGIAFHEEESDFDPLPLAAAFVAFRERVGRPIKGIVEPGMYLVGPTGAILTRVIRSLDAFPGTSMRRVILDASLNQWLGGSYWNAVNPIRLLSERSGITLSTWLFGQTCTDVDHFGPPRSLPPLYEGDLVLIGNCGAYASARQSTFNQLPLARDILV